MLSLDVHVCISKFDGSNYHKYLSQNRRFISTIRVFQDVQQLIKYRPSPVVQCFNLGLTWGLGFGGHVHASILSPQIRLP